jgi:uncharacterized membrane protein YphA (DoxX/SURF4 family)
MRVGVYFYGLATAAFGILDLVWGAFEASHQPIQALGDHIPGQQVLPYIAGVWMVAAGIAILWRRTERFGAAASAIIYVVFAVLWLPRFFTATHVLGFRISVLVFILGGVAQQLLLVAPAAVVFASTTLPDSIWRKRAAGAARWTLGLSPIVFGLGHLMGIRVVAGFVPHWIPFGVFWTVLTGIAFLLAGSAIVSGIRDILAARLLALMMLLFEVLVEIPPVFVRPHNQGAWGGAVYNLAAIGAFWIFAELMAGRQQADQRKTDVAGQYATAHAAKGFATSS